MNRFFIVTATTLALAGGAHASDGDGNFAIKGAGFSTCEDYLAAYNERSANLLAYRSWLNGFVSASNMLLPDTFDVAPVFNLDQLTAMAAQLCTDNAGMRFGEIAVALIDRLEPLRLARQEEAVPLTNGEHSVSIQPTLLRRAQEALAVGGHYAGGADGIYGPGTRAGFESFQTAAGLPVTGLPDAGTLLTLLGGNGEE